MKQYKKLNWKAKEKKGRGIPPLAAHPAACSPHPASVIVWLSLSGCRLACHCFLDRCGFSKLDIVQRASVTATAQEMAAFEAQKQ
jgi:hypothetical protein